MAIANLVTGLFAAQGVLAALYLRERTGRGQHVEVTMQEAMAALLTYQAGIYFATGKSPPRMGDAHPSICPYESLATKDGLLMLAVGNDAQFVRLTKLLGLPALATDPRFSTNRARVTHRPALLAELKPKFLERSSEEWDRLLSQEGVPAGPVLDVARPSIIPSSPRGTLTEVEHPTAGRLRAVRSPVRLQDEAAAALPPPLLGQHPTKVLAKILGLSAEELARLAPPAPWGGGASEQRRARAIALG